MSNHGTTGHRGHVNTQYHQTTYPSSPQLTYDTNTDYNKTNGLTGYNSRKTQSPLSRSPPYRPTYTLPTETHYIKGQDA